MNTAKTPRFNFTQYMMLNFLVDFCTSSENQPTTALIPDFATTVNTVKQKVDRISAIRSGQQQNITGATKTKLALKQTLVNRMIIVCGPVASYADATGNNELRMAVKATPSSLVQTPNKTLVGKAANLVKIVTPYLSSIANTGVKLASLDAINAAADAFNKNISQPRTKVVNRSADSAAMGTLLFDAMQITRNQLDPLSFAFKSIGQEDYFIKFHKARKLVPYGTQHTRASVLVVIGDTPVSNATVKVDGTLLTGTTSEAGKVTISYMPMGMQSFTVTAPGYPKTVVAGPFNFVRGKSTPVSINMAEFVVPALQSTAVENKQTVEVK